MAITIKQLGIEDVQDYKAMRLEALQNEPCAFSGDYEEESAQGDEYHMIRLQVSTIYGAYEGDAIVGMTGVILFREKKLKHKAALWGVYVRPSHRGQGIARQLMTHVLAEMPPAVRQINLGVNPDNHAAVALYKSLGFTVYGEEKNAFINDGQGCSEFLMVKTV